MTQLKFLIILFPFCGSLQGAEPRCISVEHQQWYFVGIYSACYNETNRTEINHLAEDLDKTVQYMWNFHNSYINTNATYITFDICSEFELLPDIVQALYLDERYYYTSWSDKLGKEYNFSNIVAIYAEGPPEMMNYLTASFYGDIRFTGREVSYNSPVDRENFDIYAAILHYVMTQHLKWQRLLILNVQPSTMALLYELLTSKAIESELCVHFKEVDRSWNISQEDYFNDVWFKENKPAVVTMGDKYGQIEIIKQLATLMRNNNFTIPISAEGFPDMMNGGPKSVMNFDCFKDFKSSFVTTEFEYFGWINFIHNIFIHSAYIEMFEDTLACLLFNLQESL